MSTRLPLCKAEGCVEEVRPPRRHCGKHARADFCTEPGCDGGTGVPRLATAAHFGRCDLCAYRERARRRRARLHGIVTTHDTTGDLPTP